MSKDLLFSILMIILTIISGFIAVYAPIVFEAIGMLSIFIAFAYCFAKKIKWGNQNERTNYESFNISNKTN